MGLIKYAVKKPIAVFFGVIIAASAAFSQGELPTAKKIASQMGLAWNLGNTMEATGGPEAWGNPFPTQKLIDSVK
ncbi:MAG: hypothetical protein Q4F84_05195, partial [Fibrobacter sp.]|nr:hypothetical protein [Fibrobacter sp.]